MEIKVNTAKIGVLSDQHFPVFWQILLNVNN